jgi:hypothetical protein
MISPFRLQANRRNALLSTGPKTEEGRQRSRANAVRHGLTSETVAASLEDADDYKAFEATIIADYCAETAVARELVLRLASVLWRLRRAAAIETQLFEMQADVLRRPEIEDQGIEMVAFTNSVSIGSHERDAVTRAISSLSSTERIAAKPLDDDVESDHHSKVNRQLAQRFLRFVSLDAAAFERLNRYETALWRQAVQIICVLHPVRLR